MPASKTRRKAELRLLIHQAGTICEKSGLTERQYGQFLRSIPLPEGAKIDETRAKFENGILEVTVPVQEQQSKRREIPIEASSPNTASGSGKAA